MKKFSGVEFREILSYILGGIGGLINLIIMDKAIDKALKRAGTLRARR
jgi:hypothetical protein